MTGGELLPLRTVYSERHWVELMAPAVKLAQHVSDTAFVPKGLRGNPPAIVAAIMYGDEVGLGPMQSLAKIAVIDGRPSLSSEAQRALILAAGHEIWIVESTHTKVTVAGRRAGSEHASTVTWTLDDAKRAGLAGKPNWRAYPRQMLTARATAELARLVFADAVGGLLATEELEEDGGELLDETPTTDDAPKPKRRRKSTATPETTGRPEAPAAEKPDEPPLPDEPFPIPADVPVPEDPDVAPSTPDEDPEAPPPTPEEEPQGKYRGGDKPISEPQKAKLNIMVARLVESGAIKKRQIYKKVVLDRTDNTLISEEEREQAEANTEALLVELNARDEDGVIHWSPLRDTLTRTEANMLIDGLELLESTL